eukprot:5107984-Amphidinium_carterae.2
MAQSQSQLLDNNHSKCVPSVLKTFSEASTTRAAAPGNFSRSGTLTTSHGMLPFKGSRFQLTRIRNKCTQRGLCYPLSYIGIQC